MADDCYDDQWKESDAAQNVDKKERQQTTHYGIRDSIENRLLHSGPYMEVNG
jgi:hypothetical protein